MEATTVIKLDYAGDMRRLRVEPGTLDYAALCARVAELYAIDPTASTASTAHATSFSLKYRDEDGDLITLASDGDLNEALRLAGPAVLRLTVLTPPTARAPAQQQEQWQPHQRQPEMAAMASSSAAADNDNNDDAARNNARDAAARNASNAARSAGEAARCAGEAARRAGERAAARAARAARAAAEVEQDDDAAAAAAAAAWPPPPYAQQHPNYPQDPHPDVTTGVPEVDRFINALGGLERFLPSFLSMLGLPAAASATTSGASAFASPTGAMFGPPPAFGPAHPPHPSYFGHPHQPPPPPFGPPHPSTHPHPHQHPHPPHPRQHPYGGPGRRRAAYADARAGAFPNQPPHPGPGMRPFGGPRAARASAAAAADGFPDFGPFAAAMCGPATRFLQDISSQVRRAFIDIVRDVVSAGNHFGALAAVRAAFPTARDWLQSQLGDSGPVAEPAVEMLVNAIAPLIGPHLGEELTSRVLAFIRSALADSAVVQLLRGIDAEDMPENMDIDIDIDMGLGFDGRARSREDGAVFDVHVGIQCDGCNTSPITGSRFMCQTCSNFDFCSTCKLGAAHPDHEFKEIKYPWESSNDTIVPPSPLGFRDRSPHVAHLQKLLTELGYMNSRMYARRVGFFGPKTRTALAQFQREYGLHENVVLGTYDDLTRGALFSIVDSSAAEQAATASGAGDGGAGPSSAASPAQEAAA